MARKQKPEPPKVVRRAVGTRKPLPEALEAFARGDDDALWRRSRSTRIDDPRPVASARVPGVANRDARLVYDARVKRLRAAMEAGDERALGEALADAVRLRLWRAGAIVGFDAFTEAVLGVGAARARALAADGAAAIGEPCEPGDERVIALWIRLEAGVLEGSAEGRVSLRGGRFVLEVPVGAAALALSGVGRRATPMMKVPLEPEVVVDRPRGVEPLGRIIARDRPTDDDA